MQANEAMEEKDSSSDEGEGDELEEESAGPIEMDTTEVAVKRGKAYLSQNEKLYDAEGIQNPHAKRAKKKQKKKAAKGAPVATKDGKGGDDYDFNVDYADDQTEGQNDDDDDAGSNEGDAMDGVN